jgi:hypothetical protein
MNIQNFLSSDAMTISDGMNYITADSFGISALLFSFQ